MISLYLDYFISYYNNLYIPVLSLILIISLIYFYNKKILILIPIIYDLLFSNILFFYLTFFILIYYFINYLKSKLYNSYRNYLIILISSIIIFYLYKYFLLLLIDINTISFIELIVYVFKALISSFILSFIYYFTLKRIH